MTAELKAALMIDAFEHDYFAYGTHVEEEADGSIRVETDDVKAYYNTELLAEAFDELDEKDKNEIYLEFLLTWK